MATFASQPRRLVPALLVLAAAVAVLLFRPRFPAAARSVTPPRG
jgi:hypothetical protein